MKFNADIHNRKSLRLKGYDYSREGLYFITICAHEMECLFGEIENGEVKLNIIGEKIKKEILKTEEVRENIEIHEWVIMPNHIHLIIQIRGVSHRLTHTEETEKCRGFPVENPLEYLKLKPNTIGSIISQIKSIVTKWSRENTEIYQIWHRNYYENIIRNEKAYLKVTEYIRNNPVKWEEDRYYMK